jgi:basic amino acid/polyamine antiporter, APA family
MAVHADSAPSSQTAGGSEPLRQVITRPLLLLFVIGDVLGAGIYALIGEIGGRVGGAIWGAFVVALILAVFTAFAYAELVTKYPKAAGAALYANKAFKRPLVTFVVAFAVMSSGIASAATLSRAFGGDYLSGLVGDVPTVIVAVGFLAAVALLNFRGIDESVKTNVVLTLVELGGLVLVVIVAIAALADGQGDVGRAFEIKEGETVVSAMVGGAALAFYALIGFEDSVNVAEECKNPKKDYPPALFGGLAIAGIIYLAVAMLASMVVPTKELASSDGALQLVASTGPLGIPADVFSVIALFALANGALINMIMASRIVYGMSREGIVAPAFGRVSKTRRTPWVAIVFTTTLAMVLAATGDLSDLADTTVLLLLLVFSVVNVAVLVLRRDPVDHDHFKAPSILPVIGAVACIVLAFDKDGAIWARAGALLVLGLVLWALNWLTHGRHHPQAYDTEKLQAVARPS